MCSTVSRIRTPFSSLKSNLGNIANLDTSVKTSIVDAINAAQADIDDAKADLGAVQKIGVDRKNLYDSTTAKDDKAVWADGAEHSSSGNCCSDFIDISAYKNLKIFGTTLICFYTASKEKISADSGADTRWVERVFEVPVNATYIRISTKAGYKESVYIGDGLVNFTNVKEKHISILFVGNSLTHDSVSYVPYILSTLFPEIDFSIHIFYNGGTTLASQYSRFVNDTPCANYSICENAYTWKTFWNEYTMEQVLETYKFDIVCMQDYFTFRDSFTVADLEGWNNCQSYIAAHYTGGNPLKFITLMPAPVRDNWTSQEHPTTDVVYAATENAMKLFISDTAAEDVIPCGMGIYKAMQTSLDSLGDMGHLSHDGLHAQEGIPCLLQAYIVVLWILKELELPNSVYTSPIRITTSVYESLNVPGKNVGTGVITGTDDQNLLAQSIAIESIKDSGSYVKNVRIDAIEAGLHRTVKYNAEQLENVANRTIARNNINGQEKINIEYRPNLFDASTIVEDKAVWGSDGVLHTNAGYCTSDFIDVHGSNKVVIAGCETIAVYNEDKQVITPAISPQKSNRTPVTYTFNSSVYYIRVSGKMSIIDHIYVREPEYTMPDLVLLSTQLDGTDTYCTPEMFGAVGDGVTDDSLAFESAIADGRPIRLGAKTYKANLYINRSNVIITGVWESSKIIAADLTKPIIQINADTAEYIENLIQYVTLTDFTIGDRQDVLGLKARACQSCWFERLFFNRCWKGAIVFEGVWDSRVRDCDGFTCGNTGFGADDGRHNYAIVLSETTKMKTNAVVIDGCRFEHSPRFLDIHGVFQVLITNCKFEAHTRAYDSNADYTPIRIRDKVKGLHFVNDIFTYNAVMMDTDLQVDPFNNGMPFISVDTLENSATSERITVFANCQFSTQPELIVVYFEGNETLITGCNFDRCASNAPVIVLKDFSSIVNCDMVMSAGGGTAVKIDGAYTVVDNLRVYDTNEDTSKPLVTVTNNAQRGYAKILYNGTDRANLATAGTGGFGINIEFVGLRKYEST